MSSPEKGHNEFCRKMVGTREYPEKTSMVSIHIYVEIIHKIQDAHATHSRPKEGGDKQGSLSLTYMGEWNDYESQVGERTGLERGSIGELWIFGLKLVEG